MASKSGSWQLVVVEEKVGGVGGGFRGRYGDKKWLFYAVGRICSLQDSPKRNLARPSNSAPTNFTASVKISYLLLTMLFFKSNGPNMKNWVASVQSNCEGDPIVNESRIEILVEQV